MVFYIVKAHFLRMLYMLFHFYILERLLEHFAISLMHACEWGLIRGSWFEKCLTSQTCIRDAHPPCILHPRGCKSSPNGLEGPILCYKNAN